MPAYHEWDGVGAAIVRTDTQPDLGTERILDVRPGPFTVFDGDRLWSTILFFFDCKWRRTFPRDEIHIALETAIDYISAGGTIRFGDRTRFLHNWSELTIRSIEEKLVAATSEADGALLTWTSDVLEPEDETLYDIAISR